VRALCVVRIAVGRSEPTFRRTVFSVEKEKHMLRLLIAAGAVYAAYRLGREAGRAEGEFMLLPPADYERRRRPKNEDQT
jgi:hypothetical protein